MKRILLAVSALAIAGAAALTSANASRGAYAGDCRVIRERIETPSGRMIVQTRRICD